MIGKRLGHYGIVTSLGKGGAEALEAAPVKIQFGADCVAKTSGRMSMGRDLNPSCSCRIRKRGRQPAEITREKRLCTQQTACAANGSRFRPPCCRRFSWDAVKQPRVHALRVLSLTPQLISVNYYSRRIDSLKKLLCGGPLPH